MKANKKTVQSIAADVAFALLKDSGITLDTSNPNWSKFVCPDGVKVPLSVLMLSDRAMANRVPSM